MLFTIPHKLARLFLAEEEIVAVISRQQLGLPAVDSYLQCWRARYRELGPSSGGAEDKDEAGEYFDAVLEKLVGNPVHVYTLLWRLVTRLPGLRAEVGPQLAEEIEDITSELEMPDLSDVEGATQALVRIQFAYRYRLLVPGRYYCQL